MMLNKCFQSKCADMRERRQWDTLSRTLFLSLSCRVGMGDWSMDTWNGFVTVVMMAVWQWPALGGLSSRVPAEDWVCAEGLESERGQGTEYALEHVQSVRKFSVIYLTCSTSLPGYHLQLSLSRWANRAELKRVLCSFLPSLCVLMLDVSSWLTDWLTYKQDLFQTDMTQRLLHFLSTDTGGELESCWPGENSLCYRTTHRHTPTVTGEQQHCSVPLAECVPFISLFCLWLTDFMSEGWIQLYLLPWVSVLPLSRHVVLSQLNYKWR